MEEWHQKLHNNTSPDDVVICQVFEILPFWYQTTNLNLSLTLFLL